LLFVGDFGPGKFALAESFGCDLAPQMGTEFECGDRSSRPAARETSGEMTALISSAFEEGASEAKLGRIFER